MTGHPDQIAAIRAFNRFYTRIIGLFDDGIMQSPYSLGEARVIHEIGKLDRTTSAVLARLLGMDPGQLSRLLGRLSDRGLLVRVPSGADGRAAHLVLTPEGEAACAGLNDLSDAATEALVAELAPPQLQALTGAMAQITDLLGKESSESISIRDHHQIGELGWLVHRQGVLYAEEQGWNGEFEALIARIYAEFAEAPDTPAKRLWIAERGDAVAGSVFVLPNAEDARVAQLRMLYVEPWARGSGLGQRLVEKTIAFSRAAGYRRIMLWTQDCLVAARHVYQSAGFKLAREEKHFSFGTELNGQFWERAL